MVQSPACAKEGSFLQEADFPNTAHSGTEASAGSGSPSNKKKVQKREKPLLLELAVSPASAAAA